MPSVKIAILEIDGVELEYTQEMDLLEALTYIGYSATAFDENTILVGNDGDVLTDHNGNVLVR